jgi:hypothetical protein
MKTLIFHPLRLIPLGLCLLATPLSAEPGVMRDAATHDQIVATLRSSQKADPMKAMAESKLEDPAKNLPKDLIGQSDLISFGGYATLVPKRAILQIPKEFADRIHFAEGSQVVSWPEFVAMNKGWITTLEISRAQAEGNAPLPDETHKQLSKCTSLVVCTYKGGPISMLPLKVPAPPAAATPTAPTP